MTGLDRFLAAQERTHDAACAEIRAGLKQSHWMWWEFPQLAGLGRSLTAERYGLSDRAEAAAYLAHPVLGPRLVDLARLMLAHAGTRAEAILGPVDALKLRSSATLFAAVPGADPVFRLILDAFFDGTRCPLTLGGM
ncbi:MAG: DUF1810 domain-containing protein [Rubellimicrobium sp.]|nr:DUF1810 domain-containing protein [Rubellimicrobium sp.]